MSEERSQGRIISIDEGLVKSPIAILCWNGHKSLPDNDAILVLRSSRKSYRYFYISSEGTTQKSVFQRVDIIRAEINVSG